MEIFKPVNEYAAMLLDMTGGNKIQAIKLLFEVQEKHRLPEAYVSDVFNIITNN